MPKRAAAVADAGRRRCGPGRTARPRRQVVPARQAVVERGLGRHDPAAPPHLLAVELSGSSPKVRTVPASGVEGAGDHPDGGGLARAVGAEQHGDATLGGDEVEVGQGGHRPERLVHPADLDDHLAFGAVGWVPGPRCPDRGRRADGGLGGDLGRVTGLSSAARASAVGRRPTRGIHHRGGDRALRSYGCSSSASIPACPAAATACSSPQPRGRARAVALGVHPHAAGRRRCPCAWPSSRRELRSLFDRVPARGAGRRAGVLPGQRAHRHVGRPGQRARHGRGRRRGAARSCSTRPTR